MTSTNQTQTGASSQLSGNTLTSTSTNNLASPAANDHPRSPSSQENRSYAEEMRGNANENEIYPAGSGSAILDLFNANLRCGDCGKKRSEVYGHFDDILSSWYCNGCWAEWYRVEAAALTGNEQEGIGGGNETVAKEDETDRRTSVIDHLQNGTGEMSDAPNRAAKAGHRLQMGRRPPELPFGHSQNIEAYERQNSRYCAESYYPSTNAIMPDVYPPHVSEPYFHRHYYCSYPSYPEYRVPYGAAPPMYGPPPVIERRCIAPSYRPQVAGYPRKRCFSRYSHDNRDVAHGADAPGNKPSTCQHCKRQKVDGE